LGFRVGIIGAGTMGQVHSRAWRRMPDIELIGVYDIDATRASRIAADSGVTTFSSFEELVNAVDIVDVCVPTPFHAEYAIFALEADKDVVCEKPMGRTLEECDRMIAAAEASGKTLMPAQVLRFFPEFQSTHDLIRKGAIGAPAVVRTHRGGGFPRGVNNWFADFAQSGGVSLDILIHDFDWLRWTLGDVERVYAKTRHTDGIHEDDYVLATLRFKSGAIAHVEGTWMDAAGYYTSIEAAGDNGLIHYDSRETAPLRVARRRHDSSSGAGIHSESPVSADPYYLELRHFVDCLTVGVAPMITPEDGRAAVAIGLAALESSRIGKSVSL